MAWALRFLAVLLGVVFIPLFLATVVVLRVNATVLDPGFYGEQLREAELFDFMYDEALPLVAEEQLADTDLPLGISVSPESAVARARQALPPGWAQEQTEGALDQLVPYLVGERDGFTIAVPLSGRVEALAPALKGLLDDAGIYTVLSNPEVAEEIDSQIQDFGGLPTGLRVSGAGIAARAQTVLPPEWVRGQVEGALDQLVPYLVGERDGFTIAVPLSGRVEALAPALRGLLDDAGAYEAMFGPGNAAEIDARLRELGELPFGIRMTGAQVAALLNEVLPPDWIRVQVVASIDQAVLYLTTDEQVIATMQVRGRIEEALQGDDAPAKRFLRDIGAYDGVYREAIIPMIAAQATEAGGGAMTIIDAKLFTVKVTEEELLTALRQVPTEELQKQIEEGIDDITPYLTGESDSFQIEITSADTAVLVAPAVEELVRQKLEIVYEIPNALLSMLGIDVTKLVEKAVKLFLPPVVVYTDTDLREMLDADVEESVDRVLDWTRNGITFTDADLRERLAGDGGDASRVEMLDRALDWTRNGFTYTDADLREDLVGEDGDASRLETLDRALGWTRSGFTYTDADLRRAIESSDPTALEPLDRARSYLGLARQLWFLPPLALALLLAAIGFLGGRKLASKVAWASVFLALASCITYVAAGPLYRALGEPRIRDLRAEQIAGADPLEALLVGKGFSVAEAMAADLLSGIVTVSIVGLAVAAMGLGTALAWPAVSRRRTRLAAAPEGPTPPDDTPGSPPSD